MEYNNFSKNVKFPLEIAYIYVERNEILTGEENMSEENFSIVLGYHYSMCGWTSSSENGETSKTQKDNKDKLKKGKKPDSKEVTCDKTKRIKRNLTNKWVEIKQTKVGNKCYWVKPYWCAPRCGFWWDRKKGVCRALPCDPEKCCSKKEKKLLEKLHKIKIVR